MISKEVCHIHGGKAGRPIIHGRYSKALERFPEIQERYERHKSDPALMEIMNEIALLRALLDNYLGSYGSTLHPTSLEQIQKFIDSIGRLVEKRHKMLYGEQITITPKDWETLVTRVVQTVKEVYGDDDRYTTFLAKISELSARQGSDAGATA